MCIQLLLCILASAILVHKLVNPACINSNGPIYVNPRKDIVVRVGESINVSCGINVMHPEAAGKTVNDLVLYSREDQMEIPGDTFFQNGVMYQIQNITQGFRHYYCQFIPFGHNVNKDCSIHIFAGYPPDTAKDFKCLFFNYENLTCTWNTPPNIIPTKYKLLYGKQKIECPNQGNQERHKCTLSQFTNPRYISGSGVTEFHIQGENVLGNTFQSFNISDDEYVVPAQPHIVSVTALDAHNLQFRYSIPTAMWNFKSGFTVKFEYQANSSTYADAIMTTPEMPTNSIQTFVLSQLCPNTLYKTSVYLKAASSKLTKPWSQPAFIMGKTIKSKHDVEKFNITQGLNTVHISWNFCVDHRTISKYVVEYCPIKKHMSCKDSVKEILINVGYPEVTLEDLIASTLYFVTVKAQFRIPEKNNQWSTTFITNDAVPPPMPTDLKIVEEGETTLTVNWTVPSTKSGQYYLHCFGKEFLLRSLNPSDGQHIVTGLQCGTMYECSMEACSTVCSNFTSSVVGKTKIEIERVNVTSIEMGANRANVFWVEPEHTCEEITSYDVKAELAMRENIVSVQKTIFSEVLKEKPLKATISVSGCNSAKFSVRASITKGDAITFSEWSDWKEVECQSVTWFYIRTAIAVTVSLTLIIGFSWAVMLRLRGSTFCCEPCAHCCRRTEELPIELPTINQIRVDADDGGFVETEAVVEVSC